MFKILAMVMLCFTLAVTSCSSSNYNSDEVPDVSPENLYNIAKASMSSGDFTVARRYLEAIDSRYPFGDLTSQVQLDLIYVYYKQRESDLALAQIARFIRLSPTHPNIDYVYYMKGLTEIQKRSDMIQDYLGLDRSEKDPTYYYAAFNTFRDLVRTYPNSIYAADARQRMIFIKDELAKRELAIAQYYFEREAYVSSIRHCQNILYTYRTTDQFAPAMELMAEGYERLNLPLAANNARRVLASSTGNVALAESLSAPIDPQTGMPTTKPAVASDEEKGWFSSMTDWLWGDDEDEVVATAATASGAAAVSSLNASTPLEPHNNIPATRPNVQGRAAAGATGAATAAPQTAEEKGWFDSITDWFTGADDGAAGGSSAPSEVRRAGEGTGVAAGTGASIYARATEGSATASSAGAETAAASSASGEAAATATATAGAGAAAGAAAEGSEAAAEESGSGWFGNVSEWAKELNESAASGTAAPSELRESRARSGNTGNTGKAISE